MGGETRTRWLFLAGWLAVFAAAALTRADADLWGHLRFGLDFLRDGRVPTVDPYSFTQDVPWVNHEWLSEAQMALAWALGRSIGLTMLKAALVVAGLAIVWTGLRRTTIAVRAVVIAAIVLGTIHMWATLRPQLWTFVAVSLLCRVLVSRRRAVTWLLPALFAVWVNCHGGWIVGLGMVGAWTIGQTLARPGDLRRWVLVTLACAAATLVNPYGWGLWLFMLRTVHMTRDVAEWAPLWTAPWINWLPWLAGCGLVSWMCWPRLMGSDARERAPEVLVLAMLACSSARVLRIESLFVTATAILGAPFLASRWPARPWSPGARRAVMRAAWPAAIAAAGLAAAVLWQTTTCVRVFGDWAPDVATAHALDDARPGRLVTYFDWGEWAIWHFGPRLKVSMDGRRETVYSDARLSEQEAIVAGRPDGLAALALWRAEYVWLPASSVRTRNWLVTNGYRIDAAGSRSFVAVRADLPVLRSKGLLPGADCFPQ